LEPLEVQPHGVSESYEFMHVEAMGANIDAVMQAANKCAGTCAVDTPSVETDLRALDMAKLCLQQGMPQLAKVFMDMVSVAEAKAEHKAPEECPLEASRADEELPNLSIEPISTPTLVSLVEEDEKKPSELDSPQPKFEPTALDAADEWKKGVVTCVDPLLIRPDGYKESFDFNLVEPLDSVHLGGADISRDGVQDASPSGGGGVRAERPDASKTLFSPSPSGASSKGTPPWHDLGKTIDTCTPLAVGVPVTLPLPSGSALARAMLPSPQGEDKIMRTSWLACCFAR
jgi:hypothetical protein